MTYRANDFIKQKNCVNQQGFDNNAILRWGW